MDQALNPTPDRPTRRFRSSNLSQAWLVLILAVAFGAALAAIEVNLSDIIAANKRNETLEKIPELVAGSPTPLETSEGTIPINATQGSVTISKGRKTKVYTVYRALRGDQPAGWVIKASGQGYADKIELLVGLDPLVETIIGLYILKQKETPGLGNKITVNDWRSQFIGQKTHNPLQVRTGTESNANAIDAITGATISSRAVTAIVNQTIGDIQNRLRPPNLQLIERQP